MHAILRRRSQYWSIGPPFTLLALLGGLCAGQTTPASTQKLQLTASLILTPEFCSTTTKKGKRSFSSAKQPVERSSPP